MLKNRSCPQVVPSLEGLFIEDIAVGCEHVLTLSSTGDVYAWGCNNEGQVTGHELMLEILHFYQDVFFTFSSPRVLISKRIFPNLDLMI